MAVNMSEFVPDNNLNWLALTACVYGNISASRALCCLGLKGTKPQKTYTRASELDGNSLLKNASSWNVIKGNELSSWC